MNKFWITLNGLSMTPLLRNLDEILIEQVSLESLNYGDIVLFLDQASKELTLHRLIDFPLKTKGDLSLYTEENPKDHFLGKAIGFKRDDFYRKLPACDSILCGLTLFFSKQRMNGFVIRKCALIGLIVLTKAFESYSEKTRLNHSEELNLSDL